MCLKCKYIGIWATAAICFIRQDNTTSTFLVGYQRLEGSVIGAIYAFALFQLLECSNSYCGIGITLPVLVPWTAFCAFFREVVPVVFRYYLILNMKFAPHISI
jgi:uncharacterized membrane protein YgaE (UPF0421/DUF939 family)